MEVTNNTNSYENFLLQLLNHDEKEEISNHKSNLKLNSYLTLLSLSNTNYKEKFYEEEHTTIETFLRKVNNLKVKIQLNRKEAEINKLLSEILEIYESNQDIISKYNKEEIDVKDIISSKNPKEITNLIDKLTKEKLRKDEEKEENDKLRKTISANILETDYYIDNEYIYITIKNQEEPLSLSLNKFYEIYDYLLNINTYNQPFLTPTPNRLHTILVANIIKLAITEETEENFIIPLTLTYLLTKDINYENIDTSYFNIENIKITDLYSFAGNNNEVTAKTAKWKKINIPNEYLITKIKEITKKGMYYIKENKLIFENIENSISDFKISIDINDMLNFLKEVISSLNNQKEKAR